MFYIGRIERKLMNKGSRRFDSRLTNDLRNLLCPNRCKRASTHDRVPCSKQAWAAPNHILPVKLKFEHRCLYHHRPPPLILIATLHTRENIRNKHSLLERKIIKRHLLHHHFNINIYIYIYFSLITESHEKKLNLSSFSPIYESVLEEERTV